jgi:tetratricopeptide (TPR) repeat protein
MCGDGDDKLAGIWDLRAADQPEAPRQSQIHAAFLRTGKSYAADVYETVSRALTGYAQSWSKMYQENCEATQIRHEQSEEVLDLRTTCLQERLSGFHALTDVFVDATGDVVENAVSATNALATLDRCADIPTLRAVIRPPQNPEVVGKVTTLRHLLAATKARFDAGQWKETLKAAPVLVAQARSLGYQPLLAEVLAFVGDAYLKAGNIQAAEKALTEAYRVADASRHDEVRATAATTLVFVVGYQEGRFDEAVGWSESALAVLQRLGGHELLHAWVLNDLGCAYVTHRDSATAVKYLEQASEAKEKILGHDHIDVAISEGNIGRVLLGLGRTEEALSHTDRSIFVAEKRLGSGHPELARYLSIRGEILNALGRYEEARRASERSTVIWERELGPNAVPLASALTVIGVSYLGEARPANALAPLERAAQLLDGPNVDPADRAQTLFGLARALWDSNRDRIRAKRLAEKAMGAYSASPGSLDGRAIESWLRAHASA